jgi:hypothetical protein
MDNLEGMVHETGALESIRRSVEVLDHRIGLLHDRLDRDRDADGSAIERSLGNYEGVLKVQREQYLVQITTVRRICPGGLEEWVHGHIARLEALRPAVRDLAASDLEATTLSFVVDQLIQRWQRVPGGYDEPVLEHPSLWERTADRDLF